MTTEKKTAQLANHLQEQGHVFTPKPKSKWWARVILAWGGRHSKTPWGLA